MKIFQMRALPYSITMDIRPDAEKIYYAQATSVEEPVYEICHKCGYYKNYPKPSHRLIEWLAGSDITGDFVWVSRLLGEVVVSDIAKNIIKKNTTDVDFLPIIFWEDPKLKKPKRRTKNPRVWLPYSGPPLYLLWIEKWVHADLDLSTIKIRKDCKECNLKTGEILNIEYLHYELDFEKKEEIKIYKPRVNGKGLFIKESLGSSNIFRLYEYPGGLFCTERMKDILQENEIKNVAFFEVGEIVS